MTSLRFGFVTCVQLGLDVMDEIYRAGGELHLAVTLSDGLATQKSGRVYLDHFTARHSISLIKVATVNETTVIDEVRRRRIDWLFIIGWSQIASVDVLHAPTFGCIGMHPTLLPEGRGRASIPWAILKQLPETGVTMFQLDEGVDTGPILGQFTIPLASDTNATELYQRVTEAHRLLIRSTWADLVEGRIQPQPQDPDEGTYWPGRTPEDGRLDNTMTVEEALRLVRATTHPYPGAFWVHGNEVVRVWEARKVTSTDQVGPSLRCVDGAIEAMRYDLEVAGLK